MILADGRTVRDRVHMCVASAFVYGLILVCQERFYNVHGVRLSACRDVRHRCAVHGVRRHLSLTADVCSHKELIYGVSYMCKRKA